MKHLLLGAVVLAYGAASFALLYTTGIPFLVRVALYVCLVATGPAVARKVLR
jgi:NhaP-type Na+/H+ or K+/H+ antiporter